MLTVRKYLWFALIAAVSVWILYVAWNSASFQACIANKQSQQSQESLSELLRFFEIKARVGTDCFFVFLYDSRDAVTAVATAFIAIFTLTLWWATWGLLTHGREIERAYVSGGGPHDLATRIFQLRVNNYGKTPAIMTAVGIGFLRVEEYSTISPPHVGRNSRHL
jgi:hypothetical protein